MTKIVDAAALQAWITANQRDEYVAPPVPVPPPVVTPPPVSTAPMPLGIPGTHYPLFYHTGQQIFDKWGHNWLGAPGTITKPVDAADQLSACDPACVSVDASGNLVLSALAKSVKATDGKTYAYAAGLVHSSGLIELTSGVVEARIYLPAGPDGKPCNWPAFWQNGHNWPADGESDTLEILGTPGKPTSGQAAVHFHGPSGATGFTVPGNWSGWHTIAEDRYADHIDYYYDGKFVGALAKDMNNSPRYIILDNSISKTEGGALVSGAKMLVAYCGAWTR